MRASDPERTIIKPVDRNQKIRLNDAVMIAGFPGPGTAGAMSASYIIEQQEMHQIAYVDRLYSTRRHVHRWKAATSIPDICKKRRNGLQTCQQPVQDRRSGVAE